MTAYTRDKNGPPVQGRYDVGDTVTDAAGTVWQCAVGGMASRYQAPGTATFIAAPTGLSPTELAFLDGTAAGVVLASTAAIYDSAGKLRASSASPAAAGNAVGNGTALTAMYNAVTGADGTKGVVLPVAAADEVVVVVNTDASNALKVYAVTGSQINALGSTVAYSVTPGQLAVFVGRSATLWYTAAASDTVTGLTASASELNFNDGPTAGVATANKTAVLGASKNLDILGLPVSGLKIGTAGAEVAVSADAAEMNLLDGAVVANSVASKVAMVDSNKRLQTNAANGTPEATVTAVHYGDGVNVTAVLTLTNTPLTVGSSANLGVGVLIYTLPAGACMIRDSYYSLVLSGITTATDTPDTGLGTVIASGVVTTLDGTATFENISTGVALTNPNSTPSVVAAGPTAGNPLAIATGAAHTVHVNMAGAWTANADADGLLNGTVVISYIRQAA